MMHVPGEVCGRRRDRRVDPSNVRRCDRRGRVSSSRRVERSAHPSLGMRATPDPQPHRCRVCGISARSGSPTRMKWLCATRAAAGLPREARSREDGFMNRARITEYGPPLRYGKLLLPAGDGRRPSPPRISAPPRVLRALTIQRHPQRQVDPEETAESPGPIDPWGTDERLTVVDGRNALSGNLRPFLTGRLTSSSIARKARPARRDRLSATASNVRSAVGSRESACSRESPPAAGATPDVVMTACCRGIFRAVRPGEAVAARLRRSMRPTTIGRSDGHRTLPPRSAPPMLILKQETDRRR